MRSLLRPDFSSFVGFCVHAKAQVLSSGVILARPARARGVQVYAFRQRPLSAEAIARQPNPGATTEGRPKSHDPSRTCLVGHVSVPAASCLRRSEFHRELLPRVAPPPSAVAAGIPMRRWRVTLLGKEFHRSRSSPSRSVQSLLRPPANPKSGAATASVADPCLVPLLELAVSTDTCDRW